MAVRIAINGFGRIGRSAFKVAIAHPEVEVVAVNDLADPATLSYLLTHDTAYGPYEKKVSVEGSTLTVGETKTIFLHEQDPRALPWKAHRIAIVLECTGKFVDPTAARAHLEAGAQRVIISAPSKGAQPAPTYVLGVNTYDGKTQIINNASCTTNCIAPVIAILQEKFGVEKALMTTVHGYTQDQLLQDGPHKDLRRGRAAAANIVPTTTGAALATTETIPAIKGKFDGVALRVPVPVGSISDITAVVGRSVTVDEINAAFQEAVARPPYKGIVSAVREPLVSSDIIGRTESAIVDLELTKVVGGNLVKVFAWYDNELGYSHRLVEQALAVAKTLN